MPDDRFYFRQWLNPETGAAAVEVEFDKYGGSLTIRDCSRQITLDFSLDSSYDDSPSDRGKEYLRSMHKIATLRGALDRLETELNRHADAWESGKHSKNRSGLTTHAVGLRIDGHAYTHRQAQHLVDIAELLRR